MNTSQQRVTRSPLSITPQTDTARHVSGKGKSVAFFDAPPPPLGLLNETGTSLAAVDGGDMDDWRRFKEAGLLDEATMERKDHEALLSKTAQLEKDLYDYQYNMGLLLLENDELTRNTEELRSSLAETQEVVKREEAAHYMALSEVEKRADNLRNALDYEKRCRVDLEKALREIDEENKQMKLRSQTSLADANALVAGIGDKAREVEEKTLQADAKLAEVNKKSLDLDRRMQELETHESMLQSESKSFIARREDWQNTYAKHKSDLQEWEKKLHEGEERLCEGRRIINLREEKVNEIEKTIKQNEKELEEAYSKIDFSILESKKKEDDINKRLLNLIAKEEQAESVRKNLEIKEKEQLDLTQKLTAKEKVGIQKLLDSHKEALDSKQRDFDLEIEEKRKSVEAEMRIKVETVEQKLDEINHKEEKLKKLEQALEKKSERFNEKEKEIDLKSKALKEKEKLIKTESKELESDRKQLLVEKERLQILLVNTEKLKDEITQKEMQVKEEIEKLKITEDERTNYSRLQLELKEEREKCRLQKEVVMKEADDLREERMKFEQEWEALDEKRSEITKELREFSELKEKWEKQRESEEEKLEKEKLSTKDYIKRELESVKLERETFAATMKNDESLLVEKFENEHRQFLHDFEQKKRDLEKELQNRRAELEKNMEEKKNVFEELQENELRNISHQKEVVRKELEEVNTERSRIDKEKNEIAVNSQQLEESQLELRKDIDVLGVLSKKIKSQREEFIKERNRLLEFVDKLKNCDNCGEIVRSYELSDLQIPEVRDDSPFPGTIDKISVKSEGLANTLKSPSGKGLMSWFKKSSTPFRLSPHKTTEHENDKIMETPLPKDSNQPAGSGQENIVQNDDDDDESYMGSKNHGVPESSQQSVMKSGRRKPVRKPKSRALKNSTADDSVNVNEESADKRVGPTTRKRAHAETSSFVSGTEIDAGESEVHSESVTTGAGRRKRRQTVAPPPQTPGGSRYNLRRPKTGDVAPQTKASPDNRRKKEVSGPNETTAQNHEITSAVETEAASKDAAVNKKTDTQILDIGFKTPGDIAGSSGTVKIVKNTEIIEEVTVTETRNLNHNEEDDNDDDVDDNDDDVDGSDDGSDDGSEPHSGEVSIHKKIWKFLST